MNVLEARESESLKELAANTTCPNHEHFRALQKITQKFFKKKITQKKFKIPLKFERGETLTVGLGFQLKLCWVLNSTFTAGKCFREAMRIEEEEEEAEETRERRLKQ